MTNVTLSDNTYNKLKWFVTIVLPAFSAFYFGLATLYGWGGADKVVGTIALLATFLGVLLGISSSNYKEHTDGEIVKEYDPETGRTILGLELNDEASIIGAKSRVVFDVRDKNDPFWAPKP